MNKTELEGSSYEIRAEKKTITEYLNIKEVEGKIIYTAKVLNQNNTQQLHLC